MSGDRSTSPDLTSLPPDRSLINCAMLFGISPVVFQWLCASGSGRDVNVGESFVIGSPL